MIHLEDFKKFLQQYFIHYTFETFNEMKLWMAQEGILDLSNKEKPNEGTSYIVLERFIRTLRQTCKDLNLPINVPNPANITYKICIIILSADSLQDAINKLNQKILQTYWKKIEEVNFHGNNRLIN